jgi:hypothetical protein
MLYVRIPPKQCIVGKSVEAEAEARINVLLSCSSQRKECMTLLFRWLLLIVLACNN